MRLHHTSQRHVLLLVAVAGVVFVAWWFLVYDNYHAVIPGQLYRSGQMDPSRLLWHSDQDRFATVISLRPETNAPWHDLEVAACVRREIRHIDFPLSGNQQPTREQMAMLVVVMERSPRPILIHCEHGADRTGLAVALYLRVIGAQSEEAAARALSLRYGHVPGVMTAFDRAFSAYCRN